MKKATIITAIFSIILCASILSGCASQSFTIFDIIESGSIWDSAGEFMEEYNLNLEDDFTTVQEIDTDDSRSTLYEKKDAFPIMGKNSRFIMEVAEDEVISIRLFVFLDSAKSSHAFAEKLYEKLVDNYYKPDTASALVDRISNHIHLPEDELYQSAFRYQDQWLLPPAFDERTSLLRMEYNYLPENDIGDGRYRVMVVLSRTLLEVNLNP